MNVVDGVIAAESSLIPDLESSSTLICASDYSGQHKGSDFEAYTFLISGSASWNDWEARRLQIRAGDVQLRRMSFKALGDGVKQRALPKFLEAADHLNGLLAIFLVDKRIGSLFGKSPRFDFTNLAKYEVYGSHVFERLMRVVHFMSLLISGLSSPKQNVYWFTDADDIAANHDRVRMLVDISTRVMGQYVSHGLGHFRCGTSKDCDNGSLQIEDLCAIADLAAGAVTELVNRHEDAGTVPNSKLVIPAPSTLSAKAASLGVWLSLVRRLKRVVLLLDREGESTNIRVKRIQLHRLEPAG
ncbi:MAG: hypothetical protein ACKVP0_11030 [Pirellulaceae bacterium]